MRIIFSVLFIAFLAATVHSYSKGAPEDACQDLKPQHGPTTPQTTPNPYTIQISKTTIKAGETVRLTISGNQNLKFKGFLCQARVGDNVIGSFSSSKEVQTRDCQRGKANSATHTNASEKQTVSLTWKSPSNLKETVTFYCTIAKDGGTYWVAQKSEQVTVN